MTGYDSFFYKELTRNSEIGNTPSEFCPISGDWGKLGMPNLVWMLQGWYWMLHSRVTAFTISELSKANQQEEEGGGVKRMCIKKCVWKNESRKS